MVVNTPSGPSARRAPTATRSARPRRRMDKPIITTVQQLAAAVQGIEARRRGEIDVNSLQDHARALDLYGVGGDPSGERGVVQVAGELIADPAGRRVPPPDLRGARRRRAGPTRASSSRWPSAATTSANLLRRCFSIHKVSPSGTYGGTVDVVVAAHGPGHRVAHRAARRTTAVDVVGPLGRPFPLPDRAGRLRARRRRLRQRRRCSGSPRRCASAAATSRWCSARPPRTGCSGSSRRAASADGVTVTTDDGSAGTPGLGQRRAAARSSTAPGRRRLRLRPDGHARARSPRSPPRTARWRRSRSRSRWPAASASA